MKNSKHEKLIDLVEKRIKKNHFCVASIKGKEYFDNLSGDISGEIDLFCVFKENSKEIIYVFEMKSKGMRKKAIEQLERHKDEYFSKYFLNHFKIYYFYVVGKSCRKKYIIERKK